MSAGESTAVSSTTLPHTVMLISLFFCIWRPDLSARLSFGCLTLTHVYMQASTAIEALALDGYAGFSCAEFQCMTALRLLDLGACSMASFGIPIDLQFLKWNTKHISNLPSSLIVLDLSDSRSLTRLPEDIGALSGLQTLALESCSSLIALPKVSKCMSRLQTLRLAALPQDMSCVGGLQSLP